MSTKEIEKIPVLEKLVKKEISQKATARILKITTRHTRRIVKRYLKGGAQELIHKSRGIPSNRKIEQNKRDMIVNLLKTDYHSCGPTFIVELLNEQHNVVASKETIRQIMIEEGLWVAKKRRNNHKQWRARRDFFGELVQLDGSFHQWFGEEKCTLIAFIDDATSKILWLEFARSESVESLMVSTKNYLERFGRPLDFYTDRGSVFKVNMGNIENDRVTQYQRILKELGIGIIHAQSPQAKGRIERLFKTLQDRLVKYLKFENITTMEAANRYAQTTYIPLHNKKFAQPAQRSEDCHRSLDGFDLKVIMQVKEPRALRNDFTIRYKGRYLQLDTKQPVIVRPKDNITISTGLDGVITLSLRKQQLTFKEVNKQDISPNPTPTKPQKMCPYVYKLLTEVIAKPDISILEKRGHF